MARPDRNEDLSSELYIARVDDTWERTVRCEEQIKALESSKASKKDLANIKATIIWSCTGIVVVVVSVAFYVARTLFPPPSTLPYNPQTIR